MRHLVATAAEGDEVFLLVAAALAAGDDVVDFHESGVGASGCLAAMPVTGQDPPAGGRRDGALVGLALFGDVGVAGKFFEFRRSDFRFTAAGGDVGFTTFRAVVGVDLGGGFRAGSLGSFCSARG